jgi:hypothetical protein
MRLYRRGMVGVGLGGMYLLIDERDIDTKGQRYANLNYTKLN